MKQQRIERSKPAKAPQIIDNRQPTVPDPPQIDPAIANLPLRTIMYLEVYNMDHKQVQLLIQHTNEMYKDAKGGIHYVIPVRHGCLGPDIIFEEEFLKVVNQTCEIKDGQIKLKDGAKECRIVREKV